MAKIPQVKAETSSVLDESDTMGSSVVGQRLTGNGLQQYHEHFSAVRSHQFVHVTNVFVLAAPGSFRGQHGIHLLHRHCTQQHSQTPSSTARVCVCIHILPDYKSKCKLNSKVLYCPLYSFSPQ